MCESANRTARRVGGVGLTLAARLATGVRARDELTRGSTDRFRAAFPSMLRMVEKGMAVGTGCGAGDASESTAPMPPRAVRGVMASGLLIVDAGDSAVGVGKKYLRCAAKTEFLSGLDPATRPAAMGGGRLAVYDRDCTTMDDCRGGTGFAVCGSDVTLLPAADVTEDVSVSGGCLGASNNIAACTRASAVLAMFCNPSGKIEMFTSW